jgi:hypothetical protein
MLSTAPPIDSNSGFLLNVNKVFKEYKGILTGGGMILAALGFAINVYVELKAMDSTIQAMDSKFDAKFQAIDSKIDSKFAVLEDRMNTIIKLQTERDSIEAMNKRVLQLEIDKAVREQLQKKD